MQLVGGDSCVAGFIEIHPSNQNLFVLRQMSDSVEVGADALASEAGEKAVIKTTTQPPFRFTLNWSPAEPQIVWMRRGNRKQARGR